MPDELHRLIHELQVHQIELEIQNDELRLIQAELEASKARYFDLYDLAPVGYFTVSEKGLILEANLTGAELLGVACSALIGQPFSSLIIPEDQDIYYLFRKKLFETHSASSGQAGAPKICELQMVKNDGTVFWGDLKATAAKDAEGEPVYRVVVSNITMRKQTEDELRSAKDAFEITNRELQQSLTREQLLANTDGLTGLFNRRFFFELAAREFAAAVRYPRPLTILMFDVDGLKQINDTLGHMVGDEALAWISQVAASHIREVDVLARYGGDEFVILLPQTSAQQALPMAERIRESVAARRLETDPFGITISVGIAELRSKPEESSIESVVQRADKALYMAKANGRNCIVTLFAETPEGDP
ncbi:MAG TPA: sensor domain-containing diguanylate cyclase [Dissulfurispiraceae bacterium]|nr:sensor domain-containing diguanylate cyclase [Dissulfurispiraceae bacterium]